jgi:dihydropyrimidinase/allantoinase
VPEVYDLTVRSGVLVTGQGLRPATVAVRDGRIAALLPPDEGAIARQEIDAAGLHILPGVIDPHVHTRHPGVAEREDFASGTRAAAAGGITTLLEMPISKVPSNSPDQVRRRLAVMQPQACIDFGLYGGAGEQNLEAIAGQAEAGVVAFKTFLQPPPPARLDEFFGLWCTDPGALPGLLRAVAATGLRHACHCEDAPMYAGLQRALEAAGRKDGLAHAESRPPVVEERSVSAMLELAADTRAALHIVHLSSPRSAAMVADARTRGVNVTVETCPPYLFLTEDALVLYAGFAKCNPPLRRAADVAALWRFVQDGTIDVIGTDHSPFTAEEKSRGFENIFLAPPGLCGLELLLPLMLTAASDRRLTLPQVARLTSERAAEIFRLPGKGRLAPGADADLTLVDLAAEWTFDHRRALTRSRENMQAFDGMRLRGRVVSTFVRGARVYHEGEITGTAGHGRFVRPHREP